MDPLANLLRDADPYQAPPSTDLAAEASHLAVAVVAAERRATRTRQARRRSLVGLLLAGVVVVPTGAWATDRYLAQTGLFGDGVGESVDTSEIIALCASDFDAYVRTLPTPTGALPPGHDWSQVVEDTVAQVDHECASGPGVLQQETGIRLTMMYKAQALWACEAVKADDAHDPQRVSAAGREVAWYYDELAAMKVFPNDDWTLLRDRAAAGDAEFLRSFWAANGDGECA